MIDKIRQLMKNEKIRKMISYIFFGALTTLVNWCVYVLLTWALGMQSHDRGSTLYVLIGSTSTFTAWLASVLFAFFTNKRYVFKSRNGAWKEFGLFISARVLSYLIFDLALYTALLYVMNDKLDKLLMNVLVIVFNYIASKWVVFRQKRS